MSTLVISQHPTFYNRVRCGRLPVRPSYCGLFHLGADFSNVTWNVPMGQRKSLTQTNNLRSRGSVCQPQYHLLQPLNSSLSASPRSFASTSSVPGPDRSLWPRGRSGMRIRWSENRWEKMASTSLALEWASHHRTFSFLGGVQACAWGPIFILVTAKAKIHLFLLGGLHRQHGTTESSGAGSLGDIS